MTERNDPSRKPLSLLFEPSSTNLLIGPSGAGKTPFALQQFDNLLGGGGFLDLFYPSPERPFRPALIACTRDLQHIETTIAQCGLTHLTNINFPRYMWPCDDTDTRPMDERLEDCWKELCKVPAHEINFLFIEGIQSMLVNDRKGSEAKAIRQFFSEVKRFTLTHRVEILGTVLSAKMKGSDRYVRLAHRIWGPVQWPQEAHTRIGIDLYDGDKPEYMRSERREVIIEPSGDYKPFIRHLDRDEETGRFRVISFTLTTDETRAYHHLSGWLQSECEPGQKFKKPDFIRKAEELGFEVSGMTVYRWYSDMEKEGWLIGHGATSGKYWEKAREM